MKLQPESVGALAMARQAPGWMALRLINLVGLIIVLLAAAQAATAQDRPVSFAELAERVSPAVVNITTSTTVSARLDRNAPRGPNGAPLDEFFDDFFNREGGGGQPRPRQSQALGSGFVISADGFIVTNNHVIENADEILIEFFGGDTMPATLIGTDPATDIALLKVEADGLDFVTFGDSEAARVGDWVLAVGNPLGQGFSVSAGIISARGRALQGNYDDYIQTDAAINRGNSGGPLFNMDGDVIGVNTAILSPNGGSIGIGFAMSSRVVERVVFQLQEFGETRRGWLGVRIQDVTDDVAEALGLANAQGALVTEVMDGPSREAGILSGDVITRFDGGNVDDTRDLVRRVADAGVGRAVEVVVLRDGEEQVLSVTLGLRDDERVAAAGARPAQPQEPQTVLGLELVELTDQMRRDMGLERTVRGLLVRSVEPGSDAETKGLRAGDIITEAAQEAVTSASDLQTRIDEARDAGRRSILLMVRSSGDPRFVALSIE